MKNIAVARSLNTATRKGLFDFSGALKIILPVLLLASLSIEAQVGVHTDFPHSSAAMEIYATNKGLLIPRVTLTSDLSNPSPVSSPATGLLVFNEGSNQSVGFYWWNGSQWEAVGSGGGGSTDFWSLTGNAGTSVNTNFLGTTDLEHFVIRTNNAERIRFEQDGQILVGLTSPFYNNDLFTINGNSTQNYALSLKSPYVGAYSDATYASFYGENGKYGLVALVDSTTGFGVFAKNYNSQGHGLIAVGGNAPSFSLSSHVVGINSSGLDGLFAVANHSMGTGVIALGNSLDTAATVPGGSAGAFTGFTGTYSIGVASDGIGVIGVGNNGPNYTIPPNGCGGTFTGADGIYSYANTNAGIGIVALGSNASSYYNSADGLGASLVGHHGVISWGNDATAGTGVIGAGNQESYSLLGTGSGGAFTGYICGVYGYATKSNQDRYGGYFATDGGNYAYVGGRVSNSNRKIVGTGSVSTIVKNTAGERITLTCPEAPETLFMDFGTGQLVDGKCHIEIDPDLAINIMVDEEHPLKVYVTPEGDCNGVYITNKSASGFDVIELMEGNSSVSFSWQIVATRATEEYELEDGSVEVSIYYERFPPAPGPLESIYHNATNRQTVMQQSVNKSPVKELEEIRKRDN